MPRAGLGKTSPTQTRSKIMTTFNIDTAADDRELTVEELEIVAGGHPILAALEVAKMLADATGGEGFFAQVNQLVRG
jgi:hypothetical protein